MDYKLRKLGLKNGLENAKRLLELLNEKHLTREGISNMFIEAFIECLPLEISNYFQGVFLAHEWEPPTEIFKKKNFCHKWAAIVNNVNYVNDLEIAGHFACIIYLNNYCLYLDPLGIGYLDVSIKNKLNKLGVPIFLNTFPVQNIKSSYCGLFCLLFLIHYLHAEKISPMEKISFTKFDEKRENEKKCIKYLHMYIYKIFKK